MRQFILGGNKTYPGDIPLDAGEVGFAYLDDGKITLDADGTKITDIGYILIKDAVGQQSYPFYKNNFSFSKSVYSAGKSYSGDFTLTAVTPGLTYTAILVKKGLKFNERDKWSAVVEAVDGDSVTTVAKKIAEFFNNNAINHGAKATPSAGKVTITCDVKGQDYELVLADDAYGIAINQTHAEAPVNDAKAVADMFIKAGADAGYSYTYDDFIYRNNYPLNPLKAADVADTGFTVFTLRFAEPRKTHTTDTAVNQIIQVAFPTGAGQITEFETICKKLAGIA